MFGWHKKEFLTCNIIAVTVWNLYRCTVTVEDNSNWFNKGFNFCLTSNVTSDPDRPGIVWMAAPQVVYGAYVGDYYPCNKADEMEYCKRFYYKDRFYRSATRAAVTNATTSQASIGYPGILRSKPSKMDFTYAACFGLTTNAVEIGWDVVKSKTITLGDYYATCTIVWSGAPGWSSTQSTHANVVCRAWFDAEIYS